MLFDQATGVFHEFEAKEDHTDPHDRHGPEPPTIAFGKKINNGCDPQERQTILADFQHENPAGNGGADVGPHNHAQSLGKLHDSTIDEADDHDSRDRTRLNHAGDDDPDTGCQQPVIGREANHPAQARTGNGLHAVGHRLHAEQKDAQAANERKGHLGEDCQFHVK